MYEPINFNVISPEQDFYNKLLSRVEMVNFYEDATSQALAASLVPVDSLKHKARKRISSMTVEQERDIFLIELLHWFKFKFFTWVDQPNCPRCNQKTTYQRLVESTVVENNFLVDRVELYLCQGCKVDVRFPRYNDPKMLLQTRKGRCGEWANCFTLICRALGYDARLVFDWNDHVWTEVFSTAQDRWLHCDSCENLCDNPLVYEAGWNKKMTYVIAFSKDEVQDVTWRYCTDYNAVLNRRTLCREPILLGYILELSWRIQKLFPQRKRNELLMRRVKELVEFLTPPTVRKVGEIQGRSSGSLAWREARGEYQSKVVTSYTFGLYPDEIKNKIFHLQYSCATDVYHRISANSSKTEGWTWLTYEHHNVFRKVEHDWKMAYLSRVESRPNGRVSWKFDFRDCGLVIDSLRLKVSSHTFENGVVRWNIASNKLNVPIKGEEQFVAVNPLRGATEFTLTAELSEGVGDVAWQHAQLFRQNLDSVDIPFEMIIKFAST